MSTTRTHRQIEALVAELAAVNANLAEAVARLAEVEALCNASFEEGDIDWWEHLEKILAAARGESDR